MAYDADRLQLRHQGIGSAPNHWVYDDADDESDATLVGAGFFATAVDHGMKVGDLVDVIQRTGTVKYKAYQCASVSGSAATVAAPTAIT